MSEITSTEQDLGQLIAELNIPQLEELKEAADRKIAKLKIVAKKETAKQLHTWLADRGLTVDDLPGIMASRTKREPKQDVVMYQHTDNLALVWSGHGRAPNWIKNHEAEGKSREDFRVKP